MAHRSILPVAVYALFAATPALAELPTGVRAMIDAAIATGDEGKVATVVDLAKQINPDDAAEIDAISDAFLAEKKEQKRVADARNTQAIRSASVLQRWKGKGELGGFRSTGNSDTVGLSAAIDVKRQGIDWSHRFHATADYQRAAGRVTQEHFLAAYEPRYQVHDDLFAYGLGQFERDPLQGFDARYSSSLGIGYQLVKTRSMELSVKAGPALRYTDFVTGGGETRLAGLFGYDFDWKIADSLKFTQNSNLVADTGSSATLIVDSSTTTLALNTGLEARISNKLSTKFSYSVNYDSNPAPGGEKTDTISRVTLVYGF